jgi:hypothetical protein
MMREYWLREAIRATASSDAARASLSTKEQVLAYQTRIRKSFVDALGGFPERTPLNAQVTGVIQREGYRVEKVLFESQPRHFVTALCYIPESTQEKVPGVLVPCGHSAGGKDCDTYQRVCMSLVRNGIAVLLYDPVDQGERMQLLDAVGRPRISGTAAHSRIGLGSILLGRNTATYRIWDGMRALDYLVSRPEVDADRIGCTGNSGGGTLTSYLMALDPRIKVAAPSCYITDFRHVIEKIGPQDAEQNIFGQLAFGMDHAEYLTLRAPYQTLVCSATLDFFAIEGARETVRKARHVYSLLGASEQLAHCEAEEKHGFSAPLRAGAVAWLTRGLLGRRDPVPEVIAEPLIQNKEAWVTPKGQVMLIPGARSVYELNRSQNDALKLLRAQRWAKGAETGLEDVRRVTGIRRVSDLPPCTSMVVERIRREGYVVEKKIFRPESGIVLPAQIFVPDADADTVTLYVNGSARAADAEDLVVERVKRGEIVFAVDVRGLGETQGGVIGDRDDKLGLEWKDVFVAYLLGTSYLAKRAEDILMCGREAERLGGRKRKVELVAVGPAVPAALHAAALEANLFWHTTLQGGLNAWEELLEHPLAENQLVNVVHGALRTYDLPDLVKSLPAGHVTVNDPLVLAP